MCLVMILRNEVCSSNNEKKDITIIDVDKETFDEGFSCDFPPNQSCPCQRTNTTTLCCKVHLVPPDCPPDHLCSVKEIVISSSFLDHSVISDEFFNTLGICTDSLKIIRIRNSEINNVTFSGLERLEVLDIRGNFVGGLEEPDLLRVESLYLSGGHRTGLIWFHFRHFQAIFGPVLTLQVRNGPGPGPAWCLDRKCPGWWVRDGEELGLIKIEHFVAISKTILEKLRARENFMEIKI